MYKVTNRSGKLYVAHTYALCKYTRMGDTHTEVVTTYRPIVYASGVVADGDVAECVDEDQYFAYTCGGLVDVYTSTIVEYEERKQQ